MFYWMVNPCSWWPCYKNDKISISRTFIAYYGWLQFCNLEWRHNGMVKFVDKVLLISHKIYLYITFSIIFFSESSRLDPFRRTRTIYLRCLVYWAAQYRYLKEAYAFNKYDKFTNLHIFSVVYFSTESGTLEVWDITKRKSEPIQTQNIAGRAINVICPYRQESEIRRNKNQSNDGHYISIADNSGTFI